MTCANENATATYGSLHDAFSASQRRSAGQPSSRATMPVAERFVSINGEGACAGKLAAFIRFTGCNLRCGYCDTMWANVPGAAAKGETPEQLAAWVRQTGVECVTLTGGEPVRARPVRGDRDERRRRPG